MTMLRALREDEFEAWHVAHRAEYRRGLIEDAGMTPEAADLKVERDLAAVLPDGLSTDGTHFWAVEDDGRMVGSVFLGIRDSGAWLYDLFIEVAERGRGHGRSAMQALEREVLALGHDTIALNVWGGNDVARGLYRSLGYVDRAVEMRKQLERDDDGA